jgi:hypothetical protein
MAREKAPGRDGLPGKKEEAMGSKGNPTDWSRPSDDTAYGRLNHSFIHLLIYRGQAVGARM